MITRILTGIMAAMLVVASFQPGARAQDSAADAAQKVLLRVDLPAANGDGSQTRALTLADLRALPRSEFTTRTHWTPDAQRFAGLRLHALLRHLGISGGVLHLRAANDYRVTIPVDEVRPDGALLAYERNGKPMTRRQKGPLWLVFDYDSSPDFRTETVYARSIWQLDRIVVSR